MNADGIALVLDEAGKFLEFAALHPSKQDVYLLQALAEFASRSGSSPFFVITIFHQGISAYAEGLSKTQQNEWEKVAGRYEEIIWHFPVEQTLTLIKSSINLQVPVGARSKQSLIKRDMQSAITLGWYGYNIDKQSVLDDIERIYPIHPTVIPILVRLFSVVGQNERTLYNFLLGYEPFGLRDFYTRTGGKSFFQLNDLYDYARNAYGSRLGSVSYHWKAIDGAISTCSEPAEVIALLKTVGIINLINSDDLFATKELLELVFGNSASSMLSNLQEKHLIHNRGALGGYCVWPNTSVNLEDAYYQAKKILGVSKDVKSLIRERLDFRPIVARRHYIETGTLRYFDVSYLDVTELSSQISVPFSSDGRIIVPLCETEHDVASAIDIAKSPKDVTNPNLLIVIPEPLTSLSSFLEEVRRWEWIERSVGELRQDRYAREEVSRQLNRAKQDLQKHLQAAVGFTSVGDHAKLKWFHKGKRLNGISSARAVMSLLSDVFSQSYNESPRIFNELLNRRQLSSAGASARMRLCERLFEHSNKPLLGMDEEKRPPEMSMYMSVLHEAGLHVKVEGTSDWVVCLPGEAYDNSHGRVLPAMNAIHTVLSSKRNSRVPVLDIFEALRSSPYGVKDGLIPLLLAVFAVIHEQELAFYEDGAFIPRITGSNYLRLIKAPETFEVQYYPINGVRSILFSRIIQELGLTSKQRVSVDLLDVVKPLLVFAATLPEFVLKTSKISNQSQSVRAVLLNTTDPIQLLYTDLPSACGLSPLPNEGEVSVSEVSEFIEKLKLYIDELRSTYPALLTYMQNSVERELSLAQGFEKDRSNIAERARLLAGFVTEIRLKSFCLRLSDVNLPRDQWIESLGNIICSMPPSKWRDRDRDLFDEELHKLSSQFMRVEAAHFGRSEFGHNTQSLRVALTKTSGEERDQVIHLSDEQMAEVEKLEKSIADLLKAHGSIGLAAASRAIWGLLPSNDQDYSVT